MSGFLIGVDIGGTFTDAVVADMESGRLIVEKVPSTKANPSVAVMSAVERLRAEHGVDCRSVSLFAHGSTIATNAVLESKLPRTALVVTKGFRDVLEIGTQLRHAMFDLTMSKPLPVIPRELVLEVDERLDWMGNDVKPLGDDEIRRITSRIGRLGVEACAVALLFSFRNPTHEQRLVEALRAAYPGLTVAASSSIAPEIKEYPRANTTAVNAGLQPLVRDYIAQIEQGIGEQGLRCPFFVMQSTGGAILASEAGRLAHQLILSGPAAGVVAACRLADESGDRNLITFDMGGTSVDICLICDGRPRVDRSPSLDGRPLQMAQLDIHTIGSGGGSIAWVDPGGFLRVGPRSAGAEPGPACYCRGGTEPTVTDAQVLLGRIAPNHFLGGEMPLSRDAAEHAIRRYLAAPLGIAAEEAALGVVEVADAVTARGIRTVSVNRGFDPRDFVLVAYGGAGPMHAVAAARLADVGRVIIPPRPGAFSAFGLVNADIRYDVHRSVEQTVGVIAPGEVESICGQLADECSDRLVAMGDTGLSTTMLRTARFRYAWQDNDIEVALGSEAVDEGVLAAALARFHERHEQEFGYQDRTERVELAAVGVEARSSLPHVPFRAFTVRGTGGAVAAARRQMVFFGETGWTDAPFYRRDELPVGSTFVGPCIVEEREATTVVPPGVVGEVDDIGSLVLTHLGDRA